jgi:hypothetical protein
MPFKNLSYGLAHSRAIKSSAGWARYSRERQTPLNRRHLLIEPDMTKGWLLLAEKAWGNLGIQTALLRPSRYSDDAIRIQLREWWLAGYVKALKDVKTERERMEESSYQDSIGNVSMQEAVAFSHRYDTRHH